MVPVHTHGAARGVKEQGGVLDIVAHTVLIRSTPKNIPNELVFDITNVGLNEPVHARDLTLPAGVTLVGDGSATILTIHQSRGEAIATVAAAEPEVIAKGKKEEA